ncbi:hypothetical protein CR513_44121, partial [Mucuna pruriens]
MGRQPNISCFHPFGCKCFTLNTKDIMGKFDPKLDKGTFLRYSNASKACKVYNSRILTLEESIHTYHLEQQIIGDVQDRVRTRSTFNDQAQVVFLYKLEPKSIDEPCMDKG